MADGFYGGNGMKDNSYTKCSDNKYSEIVRNRWTEETVEPRPIDSPPPAEPITSAVPISGCTMLIV